MVKPKIFFIPKAECNLATYPERKKTYYEIVTDFLGDIPNGRLSQSFQTEQEAREYFKSEFTKRNKGNEYDEYWNKKPLVINKVTIINEIVVDERSKK